MTFEDSIDLAGLAVMLAQETIRAGMTERPSDDG
jgi:hypothetical protein